MTTHRGHDDQFAVDNFFRTSVLADDDEARNRDVVDSIVRQFCRHFAPPKAVDFILMGGDAGQGSTGSSDDDESSIEECVQALYDIICRKFVFAPVCRGATAKRSTAAAGGLGPRPAPAPARVIDDAPPAGRPRQHQLQLYDNWNSRKINYLLSLLLPGRIYR